jgi:hypothetical protein
MLIRKQSSMTATFVDIKIWRFATAPKELRSLFSSGSAPEWLALVHRSLRGTEVEKLLQNGPPGMAANERRETPAKDVVYSGGVLQQARRKPPQRAFAMKDAKARRKVEAKALAASR